MTYRGVVIAVHNYDSDAFLDAAQPLADNALNAVYVKVALYGRHHGILPRVLWTQERSGVHEGNIRNPRPAKLDITGSPLNIEQGTNPANMDGDHVIVAFLENDLLQPYVQRCIPHPSLDLGNDQRELGHRMRTKDTDGQVDYSKHRGSFHGVDENGNYVIDLTRAHDGEYSALGIEPDPVEDGSVGNYDIKLPKGSKVTIQIEGGDSLVLEDKDGDAKLTIGDGAVSVAIADHFDSWWTTEVKPKLDAFDAAVQAHTHLYVFGPTGPASAGTPPTIPMQAPGYNAAITSGKTKISDG